jgi:hypothetical protein
MRFAWVCLALALVGCTTGQGSNQLGLCSTVCNCTGGLPIQQRACVDECVRTGMFAFVSPTCETCVFEGAPMCTRVAGCLGEGGSCTGLLFPDAELPVPDRPDFPTGGPDARF